MLPEIMSLGDLVNHESICDRNPDPDGECEHRFGENLTRKMVSDHECVTKLKHLLGKRESEINGLKFLLCERNDAIAKMATKVDECDQLLKKLANRDDSVMNLKFMLHEKCQSIQKLVAKVGECDQLKNMLANREQNVNNLKILLLEKNEAIKNLGIRVVEVAELKKLIARRDNDIKGLKFLMVQKEELIKHMDEKINELEQSKKLVMHRDREIVNLKSYLAQKCEMVENLEKKLINNDKIKKYEKELLKLEHHLNEERKLNANLLAKQAEMQEKIETLYTSLATQEAITSIKKGKIKELKLSLEKMKMEDAEKCRVLLDQQATLLKVNDLCQIKIYIYTKEKLAKSSNGPVYIFNRFVNCKAINVSVLTPLCDIVKKVAELFGCPSPAIRFWEYPFFKARSIFMQTAMHSDAPIVKLCDSVFWELFVEIRDITKKTSNNNYIVHNGIHNEEDESIDSTPCYDSEGCRREILLESHLPPNATIFIFMQKTPKCGPLVHLGYRILDSKQMLSSLLPMLREMVNCQESDKMKLFDADDALLNTKLDYELDTIKDRVIICDVIKS